MRTGFANLTAGVIDDELNGLMILICLGIKGKLPVWFTDVEDGTKWIVFELGDVFVIDKRITRGAISCVV